MGRLHADGAGVARLPVLRQTVDLGVFGLGALGPVAGFKVAQHGSTLVGLGALAAATVRWWRGAREVPTEIRLSVRMRRRRLGKLLAGAGIAGAVFGAAHAAFASNPLPVFAGRFVVATTSAACLGALGYGLWTLRGRGV